MGNDNQFAGDLLPAAGLVTSSEDYYPTVAINALMRNLRDPAMSSHHPQVIRSLFYIFQALHLGSVPYLPKVPFSLCPLTPFFYPCIPFCSCTPAALDPLAAPQLVPLCPSMVHDTNISLCLLPLLSCPLFG